MAEQVCSYFSTLTSDFSITENMLKSFDSNLWIYVYHLLRKVESSVERNEFLNHFNLIFESLRCTFMSTVNMLASYISKEIYS